MATRSWRQFPRQDRIDDFTCFGKGLRDRRLINFLVLPSRACARVLVQGRVLARYVQTRARERACAQPRARPDRHNESLRRAAVSWRISLTGPGSKG
jgi:hypothetical protein